MERVRIDELKAARRGDGKVTNADIAMVVFKGDKLRPVNGAKRKAVNTKRGENIVAGWNNGRSLTSLKPRHLFRLGEYFETFDVRELLAQ